MYTRANTFRTMTEPQVDLTFDCSANPGGLVRTERPGMPHLRLESVTGQVVRTCTGVLGVSPGSNVLAINLKGTLICRTGVHGRLILVPPRSFTFVRGSRLIVQASRGEHRTLLISWTSQSADLLEKWLMSRPATKTDKGAGRLVACKPIDPHFKDALARFDTATETMTHDTEPLVASFVYEVVTRLMQGPDVVQLATIPANLPETITDLIAKVRSNPAPPWPLKQAADEAGYSPFHFSRVFKAMVGYGFHEYVDRCRTEVAVDMLVSTDLPVDIVASTCGYGTTQGLRESVREYLGLVPSELRSIPDPIEGMD